MIGRLSGSVPATKESPLATSNAMVVSNDVTKIGENIPLRMDCNLNGMLNEWNKTGASACFVTRGYALSREDGLVGKQLLAQELATDPQLWSPLHY